MCHPKYWLPDDEQEKYPRGVQHTHSLSSVTNKVANGITTSPNDLYAVSISLYALLPCDFRKSITSRQAFFVGSFVSESIGRDVKNFSHDSSSKTFLRLGAYPVSDIFHKITD